MSSRVRQVQWLLIVAGYWLLQLVYLVWPVDILPDPMPGIGQIDDASGMLSALILTAFAVFTKKFSRGKTHDTALPGPPPA